MVISFITLAELHRWSIASKWGSARRRKLAEYLDRFFIFHSDDELCLRWAEIIESGRRNGRPIQPADAWVAATALLHDAPLITHNGRDFANVERLVVVSESNS